MSRPIGTTLVLLCLALPIGAQQTTAVDSGPEGRPDGSCVESAREHDLPTEPLCAIARRGVETRSDAIVVIRDGEVVLERNREGSPDRIHVMSVTKSVAALAFGRMLLDGSLESLETPISEILPSWRQGRKKEITIHHLLTHTTGLQDVPNAGLEVEPAPDVVALALAAELDTEPGAAFAYSNKAVNLITAIVEDRTGQPLDEYLEATVFADLGITDFEWIHDPAGNPYGMAGLVIGARDLARVGSLVMARGRWNGRAVIDSAFTAEATSTRHELYPNHGFLWWLADAADGAPATAFYGDGWLGQWLVVVPSAKIVAVRLIDRGTWRSDADTFVDFRDLVYDLAEPTSPSTPPPGDTPDRSRARAQPTSG